MNHPFDPMQFSPQVQKVCGPDAPPPLKQMTAGGAAPLPPPDLVTALYVLAYDSDEQLAKTARETITKMPESVITSAVENIDHAAVLDGLAQILLLKYGPITTILQNKHAAKETVIWITQKTADEKVLEIVAANEQRMLAHPEIIETLYFNKFARMSTADRAVELAVRNNLVLKGIPAFNELKQALEGELIPEASEEPSPDDLLFVEQQKIAEEIDLSVDEVEEVLEAKESGEEVDPEEEEKVETVTVSISKMTNSQKIRVATLGTSSQRAILIRDSNKLVLMAVVKSPLLKETEVVNFSAHRTLPDEALRYIANNREFTKHYQVKVNLVQNPRTPIKDALHFLNYLRDKEVKSLERDKNVSQAISRAAKNLRSKRRGT